MFPNCLQKLARGKVTITNTTLKIAGLRCEIQNYITVLMNIELLPTACEAVMILMDYVIDVFLNQYKLI